MDHEGIARSGRGGLCPFRLGLPLVPRYWRIHAGIAGSVEKMTDYHERYMKRALTLARKGIGRTTPNPAVGCVIVEAGKIIGEGWHKKAGTPHAEVHAL